VWELDDNMVSTGRKFAPEGPIDMQLPVTPGSGSLDHCFQVSSGSTPFPSWPDGPTMAISIFTKSLDKGHTIDRGELCLPHPSPLPPGEGARKPPTPPATVLCRLSLPAMLVGAPPLSLSAHFDPDP